ncbi:helix-turn-helix domain-containing protein [Campylobacter upsaliensis]|uniref:DNA binding domain-containing protein n=1 Tax=Campylobacter upsaliensis TaxID=28080 RepID=A0A381EGY5_CAMUP|nr:helix-turn-helix domain-containing protein [Campylobacter upsaliensis]EAJ5080207.1 helix-turn-helix domain-containing protein [Campylobacter upsaliensis]MCR2095674.1 helix-turn-helix domain-containing protein [Campylobacter upsaliensis]MCR2100306.1 helix-turn-helix domain-containing protein [Campylobacter upsaliensis]SUX26173.1 DNA binding domain-containing protein [Campylobacter upsaliensis]HEF3556734.1 helix-turn-helix domain-containing protein [Campylobacter upsaliensis]
MLKINNKDYVENISFNEVFLTPKEVSLYYKIPLSTQVAFRKKGLPYYKIGKIVRYKKNDLLLWLESQKEC